MAYSAYERTAGTSCLNEVIAMERHLTNEGIFDETTMPTLSQVESFITDAYYDIGTKLMDYGYSDTQSGTKIVGVLQHYNALGACAKVELTQPSVGYKAGENTRYDRFYKEFEKVDKLIQSPAFERMGATKSYGLSAGLSVGGISISDKEEIETDSDHEPYFFTRDLMKHPDTVVTDEEDV